MKKICKMLLLLIAVTMLFACINKKEQTENDVLVESTNEGEKIMENFSCETNKGNTFSLDGRSKPAFINFWATWCGPCCMEMPDLQDVYDEYKEKVDFIFVNCGDSKETISNFINTSEISYTFPIGYDENNELAFKYNITGIPTTYIVDAKNEISDMVVGARPGDEYRKMLNKVIEK